MKVFIILLFASLFFTQCTTQHIYVTRHAEKGTSSNAPSDPPLSTEGTQRAQALKEALKGKKIQQIYATPTQRAMLTAQPLSEALQVKIQTYGPAPDKTLLEQLKSQKKNTLIIGHSNTVDDIVNSLTKKPTLKDLSDQSYGDLFIITYRGKKVKLQETKF